MSRLVKLVKFAAIAACLPAFIAAQQVVITGGQYNLSLPTLTSGQYHAIQLDSSGRILAAIGGTVAVTQSGTWTVQPGNTANTTPWLVTSRVVGNAGGAVDFAGQNALAPANALLVGCEFNTTPATISTGNVSPCQVNSSGSMLVATNDTTGSATLGALNAAASIAMAGVDSAAFTLPSGNSLVGTLTPEYSNDGGTTWQATYLRAPNAQWATTVTVSSTQNTYNILVPGGASNVRVRVSAYTSGSAAATIRAVQQPEFIPGDVGITAAAVPNWIAQVGGSDGTNLRAVSTDTSGKVKVDLFGNGGAAVDQAPGSAAPANAVQVGWTDGTNTRVPYADACEFSTWTYYPINVTTNTQIVAGATSKNVYLCEMFLAPTAAAANVNIVEGTGVTCGTGTAGMLGGNTAALGAQLGANGGFVMTYGGRAWAKTATAADAMCIFASAQVTGVLAYVQF